MALEALPADWKTSLCNDTVSPAAAAAFLHHHLQGHREYEDDIVIVAATLYCWEFLMTLPAELRIYLTIPWSAPHLILFVLMRYSTMITIALGIYSTWHRHRGSCVIYRDAAVLLVQFSVSAVLGWRTVAIWQKDARILVMVALLLITLMVFSSLIVLGTNVQPLSTGECILSRGDVEAIFPLSWFYAGSVVYDTAVIVLSTFRLWRHHNDVGVFPGANQADLRGCCSWVGWLHSQWNSVTPLLFRLTSNGVLYLGFSTVFNVVCFVVGRKSEDQAQDLLLLYSSVMWVVCQHLMLLEIRATWGNSSVQHKFGPPRQANDDDDDRLIAQILQSSWSQKQRGEAKAPIQPEDKDVELAPSVRRRGTGGRSCAGCGRADLVRQSLTLSVREVPAALASDVGHGMGGGVEQLHDFRPCGAGEGYERSLPSSMHRSAQPCTMDANTSSSALLPDSSDDTVEGMGRNTLRHRLGALSSSPTRLFASFAKSTRSDMTALDHPLMRHASPSAPCTSSTRRRYSNALEKRPRVSVADPANAAMGACASTRPRCNTLTTPPAPMGLQRHPERGLQAADQPLSVEVAAMLANMSPDEKATALALAGMEASALPEYPPFVTRPPLAASRPTKPPRTGWIIQPPLM